MTQILNQDRALVVGLGEFALSRDPGDTLICYGIGSCIAFTAFDRSSGIGAMAHFVLPDGVATSRSAPVTRFCDRGVPYVAARLSEAGANLRMTVFRMAGGARMTAAAIATSKLNIGERNIAATKEAAAQSGLRVCAEDLGGTHGRTIRLSMRSGTLTVTMVGGSTIEL